ncbi:adhesion G-protein coupled receptor G2 isoform X2 [Cyclopterus lumpus]|uniref:Adhesion G-protein coupled receptor G2 n=1 Tax=Cyclopterus lumpus TaxID=8103 RepID=A0A8C2ZX74_CYCLU|nr:adhesion G-protein coupled receptor G2 isoform X2 [Cyclopterus lumpus]
MYTGTCSAQASSNETSLAFSPNTETSVHYFVDVTVNTNEQKNESQIRDWLREVFENELQSCVLPIDELSTTTTSPQTSSASTSNETTLMTTATTTLQSFNTTTAMATTTLQSTALKPPTTTTPATTVLKPPTTTTPATTVLNHPTTTTPATTVLKPPTTTTPATTVLNHPTTTTPATTVLNHPTTTTPATTVLKPPTTTTPATTVLNHPTTTTPATTVLNHPTTTTPATTVLNHPTTTTSRITKRPSGNPNQFNNVRVAREIRISSTNNTTGLFTGIDISCNNKTAIRTTRCSVELQLKQRVSSCCILQTLCLASGASSDIRVVGKTADVTNPLQCNSTIQEMNSCTFNGIVDSSCEASGGAFMFRNNSAYCDKENNTCSCSAYCDGTDAYYTFTFSTQGSQINESDIMSLISKLKQHKHCSSSPDVSCPPSIIASEFKDAKMECESTEKKCMAILIFVREVPICNVSAAVVDVFQSEKEISFNGQVTRAAICGNSIVSDSPLKNNFTLFEVNIRPASFCASKEEFHNLTCPNGTNVVVKLDEQCVVNPQPNNTTSSESKANDLLKQTGDVSQLNSSQVAELVSQLENLLSGPNVSMALGNTSVHIVSNLLGASAEVLSDSSHRIIGIVDTVGLKLVLGGEAETLLSPAVALSVKPADGSNFQETFFSISDPNNVQVRGDPRLGRSLRADSTTPQGSIRLPQSLTQDMTGEQQQLATRVQFNFYQESTVYQDRSLGIKKLNSGILGASVSNLSITELQDNVIIHLRNSEPVPANFVATCVYWDFTLNNKSGGWNPKGCFVRNSTDNETVCSCNHLTSFAILLDLAREIVISRKQATILTFITYIGCGLSAIFLSITILTYLAFGKLRKDIPSKILIQLCLALLLLNLVFLVDAWLALHPEAVGLCISTAWFLHYFLLVTFTWMGLEAVHMYQALVKVFNSHISRYMLKLSLVGWGVPMIVVIIVIAVDKDNYGLVSYGRFSDGSSDDFCWLANDIAFYVAVVAYFCVVFIFNIAMFIVVLVQLCRLKRQNPHNMQHRTTLQDVRSVAGIMILLGLTWGFAFFAWGPLNLPFMYLFAIFNSLQGFFIFMFYCAAKENVRTQWRTYLCCGRMRLAENSEWSRTATQKNAKRSSESRLTSSNSTQSNNSSSSFLASDSPEQINGIGNPIEDRTTTADENPSMDVVLNEINIQYRNQQAP